MEFNQDLIGLSNDELVAVVKDTQRSIHDRFCAILIYEGGPDPAQDVELNEDDEYKQREIADFLETL